MPKQIFVHGYLLLDERKISKSLGNVIDPLELIDVYGADAVRYWCARAVSFGQDGSASLGGIPERYERELGNDLGNLALAHDRDDRALPRRRIPSRPDARRDSPTRSRRCGPTSSARIDAFDITGAVDRIWVLVRAAQPLRDEQKPWELAKDEARAARARRRCSSTSPTGCASVAVALAAVPAGDGPEDPRGARQPRRPRAGAGRVRRPAPAEGIEAAPPLFPRLERAAAAA